MASRLIRKVGEDVLRKKARPVDQIDNKILVLLDDMVETMRAANGVGLAAPQVGVLKRIVVIDAGEGLLELINPEIVATEGAVIDVEGCLSIPGKMGEVERPAKVTVKYTDRTGKEVTATGEGLLARAFCHELDHLDGVLYIDKAKRMIDPDEE